MLFNKKSSDLKSVQRTLKLLTGFHAVKPDNPEFCKQYRHLLSLEKILKGQKNV